MHHKLKIFCLDWLCLRGAINEHAKKLEKQFWMSICTCMCSNSISMTECVSETRNLLMKKKNRFALRSTFVRFLSSIHAACTPSCELVEIFLDFISFFFSLLFPLIQIDLSVFCLIYILCFITGNLKANEWKNFFPLITLVWIFPYFEIDIQPRIVSVQFIQMKGQSILTLDQNWKITHHKREWSAKLKKIVCNPFSAKPFKFTLQ